MKPLCKKILQHGAKLLMRRTRGHCGSKGVCIRVSVSNPAGARDLIGPDIVSFGDHLSQGRAGHSKPAGRTGSWPSPPNDLSTGCVWAGQPHRGCIERDPLVGGLGIERSARREKHEGRERTPVRLHDGPDGWHEFKLVPGDGSAGRGASGAVQRPRPEICPDRRACWPMNASLYADEVFTPRISTSACSLGLVLLFKQGPTRFRFATSSPLAAMICSSRPRPFRLDSHSSPPTNGSFPRSRTFNARTGSVKRLSPPQPPGPPHQPVAVSGCCSYRAI